MSNGSSQPEVPKIESEPPTIMPGVKYAPVVKPYQLTNPPRSRVIGRGGTSSPPINPFVGLSTLQMINLRSALQARLTTLEANPGVPGTPGHVTAVNSLLSLIGKRLATTQTQAPATQGAQTMLPSVPAKQGVRPSPLYVRPL
jgi:hypothetical protein